MKKILLTAIAAIGIGAAAHGQLAEGSVFPDFTLTDINGNTQHLYAYLDSGYTVFIDISATWCAPCWAYHESRQLDTLYSQHGPAGATGVGSSTTNDVMVLFVQGEPTSGLAELYADYAAGAIAYTTSETPFNLITQGNWVAGTNYPIIDDSSGQAAYNTAWNINYFPTVYMICRDHLVHVMMQPTATEAYTASRATCPAYAPSATIDAKAVNYTGSDYYICAANPTVSFQNYSATTNITAATINILDGSGTTVGTQAWTGSLAPYAVANVAVTSFPGTSLAGYKFSVTVAGDTYAADNNSSDSLFKVYDAANAGAIPVSEDFTAATPPYRYDFTDYTAFVASLSGGGTFAGPSGPIHQALLFDFADDGPSGAYTFIFGNYNTFAVTTGLTLAFDQAYAQYPGTTDALNAEVSDDCGATWHTVWSASGAALATTTSTASDFIPSSASDWRHISVDVSAYSGGNLIVKFTGTSDYGNLAWLTNLELRRSFPTQVAINSTAAETVIAPNPATDMANISLALAQAANVQVQVSDATGRIISMVSYQLGAGPQKIALSTANLAAGIYTVRIADGSSVINKQLSVIK